LTTAFVRSAAIWNIFHSFCIAVFEEVNASTSICLLLNPTDLAVKLRFSSIRLRGSSNLLQHDQPLDL